MQRENDQKDAQLAELQLLASEVSLALGLKRTLDSSDDIVDEGLLVPTFRESINEYNFLKSASFSRINHTYARAWQKNTMPAIWPVNGRLLGHLAIARTRFPAKVRFTRRGYLPLGTSVRACGWRHEHAEWASGGYSKRC